VYVKLTAADKAAKPPCVIMELSAVGMFETRDDEKDGEGLIDGAFVGKFEDILKKLKVNDSLELAI